MTSTRQQRMASLLKQELSRIIREEMTDPRLGFITITDVDLTPDLKTAYVYVSVFGQPEQQQDTLFALDGARKFLRGRLGDEVNLRYTPELEFKLDESLERGSRVFDLLKKIEERRAQEHTGEAEEKHDEAQ